MSRDKREFLKPETVIIGADDGVLGRVDALLWPPLDAKVELADASRDAIVREVRLRLFRGYAQVCITVGEPGELSEIES
ncbi:MAG TPA: hypothetical protein VHY83_06570 [Solirubrobacteraceae bacterium]|nr:hypothetical protein [Solirubrobacteraceae bacterium]